jgi:phosphate transport system permease protein
VELLWTTSVWGVALAVTALLTWIVIDICLKGAGELSLEFLRAGGIAPILVSTSLLISIALATALPFGVGTAILLAEFGRGSPRFGRFVRRGLDVLAAVPSIVFGLFGNAFFAQRLGLGFSLLSGGLTLACMILPLLIRLTEESLRAVPDEYRMGAAALGLSQSSLLMRILLPTAWPGIVAGLLLGFSRAVAETAALLFTSGYVDRMPSSLGDSGRSLSVHIYDLAMNIPGGTPRAYATSLVLVGVLLSFSVGARMVGRVWIVR